MNKYITSDYVVSALANLPQLVFEVTDACNLRCKYCAYGEFYEDYDLNVLVERGLMDTNL